MKSACHRPRGLHPACELFLLIVLMKHSNSPKRSTCSFLGKHLLELLERREDSQRFKI